MKSAFWLLLTVVAVFFSAEPTSAQTALTIFKTVEGQTRVISNFSYPIGKVEIDFRHNFDQPGAFGLFGGYNWNFYNADSSKILTLTPIPGLIWEDYRGFSPQAYFSLRGKRYNYFLASQYAFGQWDFTFHYLELSWQVNRFAALGLGDQLYREIRSGAKTEVDFGPQILLFRRGAFAKLWLTWGTEPENIRKSFVFFGISL